MLASLGWKTLIDFGAFNVLAMPIIWFAYPEPAGRSLAEVNLLFASDSVLVGANMREHHRRG